MVEGDGLATTIKYLRRTRNGAAATAWALRSSACDKQLPPHLTSVLLLLREPRVAAGSGLGTGLGTTITYVHDHVRATEATSSDSTSSKVHRRVCYLASVHMRLGKFSLFICRVFFT